MTGACGPYYLGGSATCGVLEGSEHSEATSPANKEAPQWPQGYANSKDGETSPPIVGRSGDTLPKQTNSLGWSGATE
jgi:hypothetical protein